MFAQNTSKTTMATKTRFGVKAGVNLAKLRPSAVAPGTTVSTNLKTSFGGGFLANIPLGTGGMSFQPELLFNGQGSKMNVTTTTTVAGVTTSKNTKYEQDLRYLSVPLMLQFKSMGGFYGEVGPQLSFLLDARQDGPGDTNVENEGSFEKFEFSAGAGLGFMGRNGLGIGARYNHGLSNVLDNESTTNAPYDTKLRNSVISIGLFYHLGAGK